MPTSEWQSKSTSVPAKPGSSRLAHPPGEGVVKYQRVDSRVSDLHLASYSFLVRVAAGHRNKNLEFNLKIKLELAICPINSHFPSETHLGLTLPERACAAKLSLFTDQHQN